MTRKISIKPLQVIPALALANLRYEWIVNLCLVIALAAVIAPLLVLLGLKNGTIETLRYQLVEDPLFRELRPAQTREYPPDWFAEVRQWSEVAFVTPTILPLSSVIQVSVPEQRGSELFDLIPTAAGDPLLLENQTAIPQANEVVLTSEAAQRLGVVADDMMILTVSRASGGRSEHAQTQVRVSGVLPPRGGQLARVYAPLDLVLDVEAYKEGYGSVQRGWPGSTPEPFLSFDGALLVMDEPLTPIAYTGLIINTGFSRIQPASSETVAQALGFVLPEALTVYQVLAPEGTITAANLRALEQKLRGQHYALLPYAQALDIRDAQGQTVHLTGLSLNARQAALLGIDAPPWGAFTGNAREGSRLVSVLMPESAATTQPWVSSGVAPLTLPLNSVGQSPLQRPMVPIELLGVLNTARQRAVSYDPVTEQFALARSGYRGFRLYAERIDDVPLLFERMRHQGIEVLAEVEAIQRIQVLDAGLTRLFWLIATLGLSGGTAVLIVSLYAAVERRRRDFGVLRLVGLARHHVLYMPLVQGTLLAVCSLAAGFLAYALLATAININFADELIDGQRFCALPPLQGGLAVLVTLVLALLAAVAAAWRTTLIDPAEVLREQ